MIKRIVKLTFDPHHLEDFRQIFAESKQKIGAFEGCHHVELLQGIQPDNVFFTFSVWDDEAALDRYRQSELFKTTWAKTKILFTDKPAAWSVTLEDEAE
jgi:quinol monooxygenase YgiN